MAKLTQKELDERIAILKRFRHLLEQQRSKFRDYLNVLEKQQNSIVTEDADALLSHTELEQQVVANIATLQKVIVPIRSMYGKNESAAENETIEGLQNDLSDLQTRVLSQNAKNRELLQTHLSQIRSKIRNLRNPYNTNRSVYAEKTAIGSYIEIEA